MHVGYRCKVVSGAFWPHRQLQVQYRFSSMTSQQVSLATGERQTGCSRFGLRGSGDSNVIKATACLRSQEAQGEAVDGIGVLVEEGAGE